MLKNLLTKTDIAKRSLKILGSVLGSPGGSPRELPDFFEKSKKKKEIPSFSGIFLVLFPALLRNLKRNLNSGGGNCRNPGCLVLCLVSVGFVSFSRNRYCTDVLFALCWLLLTPWSTSMSQSGGHS